ncbi:hypothetical protein [Sporocytophaga myxococcoides]|nr:hypothetical protein [Sporocytophaga myxococcoides]
MSLIRVDTQNMICGISGASTLIAQTLLPHTKLKIVLGTASNFLGY